MIIGDFDASERVLVVAEIGNNHEGNLDVAREMVVKAAECGVDAVKFQTFKTEYYISRSNIERFNRLKSFELTYSQFEELSGLAKSLGLVFMSTPFDLQSAEFLEGVVDAFKIASPDNTFYPLIERVTQTGKPIIISLGLADLTQVERTVAFVQHHWTARGIAGQLGIQHCVTGYPVPPDEANLRTIEFLQKRFDCTVGYSDHTIGITAALLAVALGARIIEKHFTLDKRYSDFRDHQLSADPAEMKQLVQSIRVASLMLGKQQKALQPCEELEVRRLRRSIVAGTDMSRGHRIAWPDLTWVRPAGGLAPGEEHLLVGKMLKRDVRFGELLCSADVE